MAITYGVYNDGTIDREYGYLGDIAFFVPEGDLHCRACHPYFGPGGDPPDVGLHTRFYRVWLDIQDPESTPP
jgi:hypothetical protein